MHGRLHVGRVMIYGFMLIAATGMSEFEVPLWAAAYLHDLSRQHDGYCEEHGGWAYQKFLASPVIKDTFVRGGLRQEHLPSVKTAVTHHCFRAELDGAHPHYRLTSLLKDADALDRIRLGDLDPSYLRNSETLQLIRFAETLYYNSDDEYENSDPALMPKLWDTAQSILADK